MKRLALLAVAVLGCSTLTFAQAAAETAVTTTKSPVIRHRYHRQQARIAQGVRSGELTPRETARLERREGHVRRETRRMKADGNFTPAERAKVRRDQKRLSRQIYRQKHDAQRVR